MGSGRWDGSANRTASFTIPRILHPCKLHAHDPLDPYVSAHIVFRQPDWPVDSGCTSIPSPCRHVGDYLSGTPMALSYFRFVSAGMHAIHVNSGAKLYLQDLDADVPFVLMVVHILVTPILTSLA